MLFVLVEPGFDKVLYCEYLLKGILFQTKQNRIQAEVLCDFVGGDMFSRIPKKEKLVIAASSTEDWLNYIGNDCLKRGIETIHVPWNLTGKYSQFHSVGENQESYLKDVYSYLIAAGCKNITMYINNPLTSSYKDRIKINYYEKMNSLVDGAHINTCIDDGCYENIVQLAEKYDAVIIPNNVIAANFIRKANYHGVKIPGELYVISLTDSKLMELTRPSITAVSYGNHYIIGCQAVKLFKNLIDGHIEKCYVHSEIPYEIIPRESTNHFIPDSTIKSGILTYRSKQNQDWEAKPGVKNLSKDIEKALFYIDNIDMVIIKNILDDQKIEQIAENIYMSVYPTRYRIQKICKLFNVEGAHELKEYFKSNYFIL